MAGVVGWLLGFEDEEDDEELAVDDELQPRQEAGDDEEDAAASAARFSRNNRAKPSKSQIASANRIIQELFESSQQ
jgi:hypothetical protein